MQAHDRGDQAEAEAAAGGGAVGLEAYEALQDFLALVLGDAWTGVGDDDLGVAVDVGGAQGEGAAGGARFDGVVGQDLVQQVAVGVEVEGFVRPSSRVRSCAAATSSECSATSPTNSVAFDAHGTLVAAGPDLGDAQKGMAGV